MTFSSFKIGKPTLLLATAMAVAMCVITLLCASEYKPAGSYGLIFPSPSEWITDRTASWVINLMIFGLSVILIWLLNRTFNFIRSSRPILSSFFLVLCASCPWTNFCLQSSILICLINIISLWILFSEYDSPNATHAMFVVATLLSVGSMFQYAFLPFVLYFLIGAVFMKILRPKELCAYLLGLIAPWWILIGFGVVAPLDIRFQVPSPLFNISADAEDFFILLVSIGFATFIGIVCAFSNAMKIYAGNSRISAMNGMIYWLGVTALICIIFDAQNLPAYIDTLFLCVAIQLANFCSLRQLRYEGLVWLVVSLLFIMFFILMIL